MTDVIREQAQTTENPGSKFHSLAGVFRDIYQKERQTERSSGMMYQPSEARLRQAFSDWLEDNKFEVEAKLSKNAIYDLGEDVSSLINVLNAFRDQSLRNGHIQSSFETPTDTPQPGEVCRFSSSYKIDTPPSAIVYFDGEKLKYRLGPKQKEKEIFDLTLESPAIESGELVWETSLSDAEHKSIQRVIRLVPDKESEGMGGTYDITDILRIEKDTILEGGADVPWEQWDKSFDAQTDGFKAAGFLVFGYLDRENNFHPANSKENVFEIFDTTGGIDVIAYNPQPVKVNVKVKGFDEKGKPVFGVEDA